ncbi:MAG: 2-C-methyl-D-erythritol 4-phosphate cytidylyltransferase [Prevotellaceae bacterium]|jgi:2-C-methyl-D-erythritol 4-phosphate cytidylyltransferase|nr:2-C-methyl-D-erythritol 4-phosphate cytidylyltransferase [Prevotellaceae bacterium]
MSENYVIIAAGGNGVRMGAEVPKQFILLNGKPILMHTIETFYNFDKKIKIVLALPTDAIAEWKKLCRQHSFKIKTTIVEGGKERFHSVKNALSIIPDGSLAAIHDGVRPFVSKQTIERCFSAAEMLGNAIPVLPLEESMRLIDGEHNSIIDRTKLRVVQTPQVFRSEIIKRAYQRDFEEKFTDDASVLEKSGYSINLIQGNRENIKITTPFDLKTAAILLEMGINK